MGILKTIKDKKDNFKNNKDIQEKIKVVFEKNKHIPAYSLRNKPEKEIQRMKNYLKDEIKTIDDCLTFMGERGKSEENSNTFNNLSVLKKQINNAIESEINLFYAQLSNLSNIGNIICKKVLNDAGTSSGKKLALNSNLRIFDKQARKWSGSLTAWNGIYNYKKQQELQELQNKIFKK